MLDLQNILLEILFLNSSLPITGKKKKDITGKWPVMSVCKMQFLTSCSILVVQIVPINVAQFSVTHVGLVICGV